MEIIISHKSALEYWRLHTNEAIDLSIRQRQKNIPASLLGIAEIRELLPFELSYPINLMVGSPKGRWKAQKVKAHVYNGPVPDQSFRKICDKVSVSSPAFCFFQMAGDLPLIKLIELGFELCGSYSLPVSNGLRQKEEVNDKNIYNHPQLTYTREIKSFVSRLEGVRGHKNAFRALRYIVDGSASPMETLLVMLLTLPHNLGGYGFPKPELNKRIDISKGAIRRSGKAFYVCDLFWSKANLAVEYDSVLYHTGAEHIISDSKKRMDLATLGVEVITVTGNQIRNINMFETLAKLIACKLHKRLQYDNTKFLKAQNELRNILIKTTKFE